MKSTGEVLGIAESFGLAFWKAQEAVTQLPTGGAVLITVAEFDRLTASSVARQFANLGFRILATAGTHTFLASQGITSVSILKEHEGRPNITDAIKNKEIQLVINTPWEERLCGQCESQLLSNGQAPGGCVWCKLGEGFGCGRYVGAKVLR